MLLVHRCESLVARVGGKRLDKIMATRKPHSPEQIVRKLTAAVWLLAEGTDTAAVCRELGSLRPPITVGAASMAG